MYPNIPECPWGLHMTEKQIFIRICTLTLATTISFSLLSLRLRTCTYLFYNLTPSFSLLSPHSLLFPALFQPLCMLVLPFSLFISLPSYLVYYSFLYITYSDEVTRLMRLVRCAATRYCACNPFSFRFWRHQKGRKRCTQIAPWIKLEPDMCCIERFFKVGQKWRRHNTLEPMIPKIVFASVSSPNR